MWDFVLKDRNFPEKLWLKAREICMLFKAYKSCLINSKSEREIMTFMVTSMKQFSMPVKSAR